MISGRFPHAGSLETENSPRNFSPKPKNGFGGKLLGEKLLGRKFLGGNVSGGGKVSVVNPKTKSDFPEIMEILDFQETNLGLV